MNFPAIQGLVFMWRNKEFSTSRQIVRLNNILMSSFNVNESKLLAVEQRPTHRTRQNKFKINYFIENAVLNTLFDGDIIAFADSEDNLQRYFIHYITASKYNL
jgi:hypothetical protein